VCVAPHCVQACAVQISSNSCRRRQHASQCSKTLLHRTTAATPVYVCASAHHSPHVSRSEQWTSICCVVVSSSPCSPSVLLGLLRLLLLLLQLAALCCMVAHRLLDGCTQQYAYATSHCHILSSACKLSSLQDLATGFHEHGDPPNVLPFICSF
jgi:hypothetical protein